MPMAWVDVTESEARQHPCYGFGGWLWLFYAVQLFLLGITLYWVLQVVKLVGPADLTEPSMAVVWIHLLLGMPFLLLAPLRARTMPLVSISCYWIGLLLSVRTLMLPGVPVSIAILLPLAAWIAWGAVYTGYLLQSRRVNVTYRHRVHAAEAASHASDAAQA
jgi:hypothetical protein